MERGKNPKEQKTIRETVVNLEERESCGTSELQVIECMTEQSVSDWGPSLARPLAQPSRGRPRNGFTLALKYGSETVFKHQLLVVLGIESKSQRSFEKTWLGIIGLSNF